MQPRTVLAAALAASLLLPVAAPAADAPLTTVAERSGFQRTGRYEETIALCEAFAARHPDAVRCERFGTTPEGRPMLVLVASRSGALTPEAAQAQGLPVTLIQGGIHAGEIDGKDAGFLALRQLLDGEAAPGALGRQVLLFVPVFNVDGHERFAAWNRPNQRGPEEMGWRTTAQNLNLNRDYLKADAPEMQAMLALMRRWDVLALVDLHATDGAQFEHDVSIQVEPVKSGDVPLREVGRQFRDGVIAALRDEGSLPLDFYPSFVVGDDPSSGFEDGVPTPRFSNGFMVLANRLGMLVETHSWKPYPERVRTTRNTIVAVLELMAEHGARWRRVAQAADRRAQALAGTPVPLDWAVAGPARTIEFRGYAYTRTPSDVSGATMTRYDETTPQVWRVPLRTAVEPSVEVAAPGAGYVVPAAHAAWVGEKLRHHGVIFSTLQGAHPQAATEVFRATSVAFGARPFEGHQRATLAGGWAPEAQDVGAGALFVPIAQPRARLAMALLEPQAPDSLAAWGEFNNAFERKEYMEDYVAEDVARDMLRDPAVRRAFEARLRDPGFAADPQARLDFFYRRHSAWDERLDLYPVLRVERPLE
ncbi:M14 family metallopeptidase [Coralloluteibacterium stylophorae]|uniref:M14 family metallopeptidase n=1 Tax=Coralloluteibacterium stylophorae TaxID=1776034 RepID=A0A8J8AYF1_9GAMM|nr:M14 family metallopeptidase [Coralloluteibacterium stylophorae]MBS7455597.1 M14 family metallopeptidase [Coralloluteibacterium stylophorae]